MRYPLKNCQNWMATLTFAAWEVKKWSRKDNTDQNH